MSGVAVADEWLTVEQAATLLRVNPATIYRWCKSGEVAHARVGRTYRVQRSSLERRPGGAGEDGAAPAASAVVAKTSRLAAARVIAIANQKGGVGKTTTSVNLGAALAERGLRVVLIDMDPQANATATLTGREDLVPSLTDVLLHRVEPSAVIVPAASIPNLWVLPANIGLTDVELHLMTKLGREFLMRPIVATLRDAFDVIVVDCPPSLGVLTIAGLVAADEFIVPVRPHLYSAMGIKKLFATVAELRETCNHPQLRLAGILVNQGQLGRDGAPRGHAYQAVTDALREGYGRMFATTIPDAVVVEEAHQRATSVTAWSANSPVAHAYRALAAEVLADA